MYTRKKNPFPVEKSSFWIGLAIMLTLIGCSVLYFMLSSISPETP